MILHVRSQAPVRQRPLLPSAEEDKKWNINGQSVKKSFPVGHFRGKSIPAEVMPASPAPRDPQGENLKSGILFFNSS